MPNRHPDLFRHLPELLAVVPLRRGGLAHEPQERDPDAPGGDALEELPPPSSPRPSRELLPALGQQFYELILQIAAGPLALVLQVG